MSCAEIKTPYKAEDAEVLALLNRISAKEASAARASFLDIYATYQRVSCSSSNFSYSDLMDALSRLLSALPYLPQAGYPRNRGEWHQHFLTR